MCKRKKEGVDQVRIINAPLLKCGILIYNPMDKNSLAQYFSFPWHILLLFLVVLKVRPQKPINQEMMS